MVDVMWSLYETHKHVRLLEDQAYYYSGYIICGTNMWPYFFGEGFEVICICKGDSLITTSSPSL